MAILEHGGLPGWAIAVTAVATGGGGVILLFVTYKLFLTKSGTVRSKIYLQKLILPRAVLLNLHNMLYSSI